MNLCSETAFARGREEKIGRGSRVLVESGFVRDDLQVFIEADLVIRRIRMPLAGHPHIFHSMESIFDRALGQLSPDRANTRPRVRLVFLSAKPAAQALDINLDVMHRQARNPADGSLDRGRPLS